MKKKFIETKVFKFLSSAAIGIVDPLNIVKSVGVAANEHLIQKNKESKAGGEGKWDLTRITTAAITLIALLGLMGYLIGKIDVETLKTLLELINGNGSK